VATYVYRDEAGAPLYEQRRYEPKRFLTYLPGADKAGGTRGVRRVPYNLPGLVRAKAKVVHVAEGEKDLAALLDAADVTATTNSHGAGQWLPELTGLLHDLGARTLVVHQQGDEAGRARTASIGAQATALGMAVWVVPYPEGTDVADYLGAHGRDALLAHVNQAVVAWAGDSGNGPGPAAVDIDADAPGDAVEPDSGADDTWAPGVVVVSSNGAAAVADLEPFAWAFPHGHYVRDWAEYFAARSDVPREYLEMGALALLALASPGVRWNLDDDSDRGLRTNTYSLLVGPSGRGRKTWLLDKVEGFQRAVLPGCRMPDTGSPEGLVEYLADHPRALAVQDEFGGLMGRLGPNRYTSELRPLLLRLYNSPAEYEHHRTKKRTAQGDSERDTPRVLNPHVVLLGGATPEVVDDFALKDLTDGLLARILVAWPHPATMPPERSRYAPATATSSDRNSLLVRLRHLVDTDKAGGDRPVHPTDDALDALGTHEGRMLALRDTLPERLRPMVTRATDAVNKVAMLAAWGRPGAAANHPDGHALPLAVTSEDVGCATRYVARALASTLYLARRVGMSEAMRTAGRMLEHWRTHGRGQPVLRRDIARALHLPWQQVRDGEATLVAQGHIAVRTVGLAVWWDPPTE